MATSTKARRQFQAVFANVICSKQTADIASLVDGAGATQDFTVTGAALGDFVIVTPNISLQGITVTGYVKQANTVSVRVQNESGGTIDLASCSWFILVLNPSSLFA
jgi:hypothetical protein